MELWDEVYIIKKWEDDKNRIILSFIIYNTFKQLQCSSWIIDWLIDCCCLKYNMLGLTIYLRLDWNFCLLCAYIRYSMFYFLYLEVYFIFFDFTVKRPNKENRTWNNEYMHTRDRSFGLYLRPIKNIWVLQYNYINVTTWISEKSCSFLRRYLHISCDSAHEGFGPYIDMRGQLW